MLSSTLPPGLYALCDDGLSRDRSLLDKARLLLEGGVRVLQVRIKHGTAREGLETAREVARLCRAAGASCIVNDRVDWALLVGAAGVHLGEDDLPVEEARRLLGPRALIGATVRDLEGVRRAARSGADHVGLGPVFRSTTKPLDVPPLGLSGLADVCRASPLPVVAIAGIGLANIQAVAESGAHAAAVGADLLCAPDISERARLLRAAFEAGSSRARLALG